MSQVVRTLDWDNHMAKPVRRSRLSGHEIADSAPHGRENRYRSALPDWFGEEQSALMHRDRLGFGSDLDPPPGLRRGLPGSSKVIALKGPVGELGRVSFTGGWTKYPQSAPVCFDGLRRHFGQTIRAPHTQMLPHPVPVIFPTEMGWRVSSVGAIWRHT